ncbi:MAG: hypothetical protein HOI41_23680, partial [Acidimicrobiaceae bacterium]|nr:hypothetical protein [Acidimicrobiaceae bacterium]
MTRLSAIVLAYCLVVASCGSTTSPEFERTGPTRTQSDELTTADGYLTQLWADGFDRPTQMVFAPDGDLVIAELGGGENEGVGHILRVAGNDLGDRTVLQQELDKPTGIAITGDLLWIMERDRLSVTTL